MLKKLHTFLPAIHCDTTSWAFLPMCKIARMNF